MRTTSKHQNGEWPKTIKVTGISGITAKIYKSTATKKWKDGEGKESHGEYVSYIVGYTLLGKRKLETFAAYNEAEAAAKAAIRKIDQGEQEVLELTKGDRDIYLRAKGLLASHNVAIDEACRVYSEFMDALGGIGTPLEAARDYRKRHNSITAKISVVDAVKKMIEQEEAEQNGKRKAAWVKLLKAHVQNKFARDFNCEVHTIEPRQLSEWLGKLECAERTKKNVRDAVKHFFKWCRGQGYIAKDADPLADVQDYRKRRRGVIHILTPDELQKLLKHADEKLIPYIALRAFSGLRDAEATAIDWKHIDLEEGWITITEEVAKQSDDEQGLRRLIPIRPCLKAWLKDRSKASGRVYPFYTTSKQIAALCEKAGVEWKRNCLRHSCISYSVAQSGDFAAVAIQSGNSVAVIKQHYYQVVKPAKAAEWFAITPEVVADMPAAA
jgi:integrase